MVNSAYQLIDENRPFACLHYKAVDIDIPSSTIPCMDTTKSQACHFSSTKKSTSAFRPQASLPSCIYAFLLQLSGTANSPAPCSSVVSTRLKTWAIQFLLFSLLSFWPQCMYSMHPIRSIRLHCAAMVAVC